LSQQEVSVGTRSKRVLDSLTASAGAIKGDETSAGDIAARVGNDV